IGFASENIAPGDHVHVHNVAADEFERDYAFCRDCPPPPAPVEKRTWMGYDRGDGRYGTRNYVALISTVNCSASANKSVPAPFRAPPRLHQSPTGGGGGAPPHTAGSALQSAAPAPRPPPPPPAASARHANVAAYVLVGLGCETGQAIHLIEGESL